MTAESFLELKAVLDHVKRQYIRTEKNFFIGNRSADKFSRVATTNTQFGWFPGPNNNSKQRLRLFCVFCVLF